MVEPRYRWQFPAPVHVSDELRLAGERHGLSARLLGVLAARGIGHPAELDAFLAPPLDGLHDPSLLPDAAIVVDRIGRARTRGERVLVFGDFDADGLTGLAIMTIALRRLGIDAQPYVPSRLEEGHGLSLRAVETAAEQGRGLIVTVDCGTTSGAEIAVAAGRGIDVIVTDHHHLPPVLPPALALVNPHRADSRYPDPRLAGSGVAFKVAQLLMADMPGGREAALELAELAAIGAVSDVVPILGENRSIVRLGLERLRTAPRPGLAALLARAGVVPASVELETIGFVIAPRLNAAGRVGEAVEAARLLLAEDSAEAATLAEALEAANQTRREATKQALAEARLALVDDALAATTDAALAAEFVRTAAATVVRGPWPVGIVGLVAARLAEETGRPAVVGAELEGIVRASCRNGGGLDLAAALEQCGELLIRFGGHRGAAGFEIAAERWEAFRERFLALAAVVAPPDPRPTLQLDLALPAGDVDYRLLAELARLAPTGPGNPDPLVGVFGLTVTRVRQANGGHTQLTVRRERDVVDAIAFGRDDLSAVLAPGDRVDVVARLVSRRYGGYESLQLDLRDVAPSGHHPEAAPILGALAAP
ncbi:MAG: single-stranded-DNA-specific exonuclease RecJ [Chloroflexota bacterium]